MIRLALTIFLLPTLAFSQELTVRSGEHDAFTRLVISIGTATSWAINPTENGYRLSLDGQNEEFDLSSVFTRIPRDRLRDLLQPAPGQLDLIVDCECDIEEFLWRPDQLVVDIVDAPDGPDESAQTRPIARTNTTDSVAVGQTAPLEDTSLTTVSHLSLPDLIEWPGGLSLSRSTVQELNTNFPSFMYELGDDDTSDISAEVRQAESALLESIARAAAQGFIEPTPDVLAAVRDEESDDMAPPPLDLEPQNVVVATPNRPGVGISTALDRNLARLGEVVGRSMEQRCLPADLFAVSDWGSEDDFHEQVAALAEPLAGEFGQEPLEARTDLARLYIHFGFGAEALTVLDADSDMSQSRSVLREMATLIDEYEGAYPLLSAQAGCVSDGALWAFMSSNLAPETQEERNAIIQSFLGLPKTLRGHLAALVSEAFLNIGDDEAAERVLRDTDSHELSPSHDVQAMRAEVSVFRDDTDEAISTLATEARDNGRTSPESLVRLIDLILESGEQPDEADLLLAAAMRAEHRDTPAELHLLRVEILGHTARDDFDLALRLLEEFDGDGRPGIRNQVVSALADRAPSADFLEFSFMEDLTELFDETENSIAARLMTLGFHERAGAIISDSANRAAAAERRYLRAEAYLGAGAYLEAIDAIIGMDDERAQRLRSQAYEGLGEYRSALSALDTNDEESTPALQFRAEAWERLVEQEDTTLSQFAEAYLESPQNAATDSLADRRAVLERAQSSRQAVEDLLLRFEGADSELQN